MESSNDRKIKLGDESWIEPSPKVEMLIGNPAHNFNVAIKDRRMERRENVFNILRIKNDNKYCHKNKVRWKFT